MSIHKFFEIPRLSHDSIFSKPFWLKSIFSGLFWFKLSICILVLFIISGFMLFLGDKISKKDMVLTRFMATSQAPLSGQFYPSIGQKDITVLLYDDQFIRETGNAWPISYSQHADWILRLAEDDSTKPKAIFIDVTFTQKRDDKTLPILLDGLCKAKKIYGVDIYIAALHSPNNGNLYVRDELMPGVDKGCFELVGVNYQPDVVDRIAWDYPLHSYRDLSGWKQGLSETGRTEAKSAALSIATTSAHINIPKDDDSIALVWGVHNQQPAENRPELFSYCHDAAEHWLKRILNSIPFVKLFTGSEKQPICPYNLTYSVSQLLTLPPDTLSRSLKDKYVMIGAAVSGQNDLIDSPVHGLIPGVYLHSMALDNLLTFQHDFKRSSDWNNPSIRLVIPALLTISIVLLVHIFINWVLEKTPLDPRDLKSPKVEKLNPRERIIRFVKLISIRPIRLALQILITMFTIVTLQHYFSIGMLPVIELIGMTILAEMFDYMDTLKRWTTYPPE